MKISRPFSVFTTVLSVSMMTFIIIESAHSKSNTFFCGKSGGKYTTMAKTSRGNVPVIRWVSNYFSSSGYNPQKRCQIVSKKFQQFNQAGILQYLTTGVINGLPVICATGRYGSGCEGVLFTLKSGQNPNLVLRDLMSVRNRASGPIKQLGGESGSSSSDSNNSQAYINMDNYLKNATAEQETPNSSKSLW